MNEERTRTFMTPAAGVSNREDGASVARRILASIVFIPCLIIIARRGGFYFLALIDIMILVGLWEFYKMMEAKGLRPYKAIGIMSGLSAETSLATVLTKRLQIIGTTLRSRPLEEKIQATQAFAHQVLPLLAQGRLQPVIDSVVDFDKLHEATERMERNENTGKIVLAFT